MSLYTDLLELFTPYANAIKSKADASSVYTKQQVDDAIDAITIPVDYTLTHDGEAADAKTVGDALDELNESLDDVRADLDSNRVLSDPLRLALADLAEKVYYKVDNGRTICDAIITALYSDAYPRLKAVFNPGSTDITTSASLSDLKQYLTVTYYAEQGATGTEIASANYTLSGSLNEGMNIITVTYNNVVGSFLINVVDDGYYNTFTWEWTSSESTFGIASVDTSHRVSRSIVGLNVPSPSNYKRKTLLATKGTVKMADQNGNDTLYHMIPVPPTATGASVSITPNTLIPAILLAEKDGDVYKKVNQSGWGSPGAASMAFTAGENQFVLIVVKHGTSESTAPAPTKYTLTFT